jgi:hypothetical protein
VWREGIFGPPEARAVCDAKTAENAASRRKTPAARGVTERARSFSIAFLGRRCGKPGAGSMPESAALGRKFYVRTGRVQAGRFARRLPGRIRKPYQGEVERFAPTGQSRRVLGNAVAVPDAQ